MLSDEHQASQAEKIRCSFRSEDGAQCDWLEGDALRIEVGGYVIVKSLRGWHGLETTTRAIEARSRADALEEAAKVCDEFSAKYPDEPLWPETIAKAIRALATGRK